MNLLTGRPSYPIVGIVGAPGSGKSAVWRACARREIVLVTETPTMLMENGLWDPCDRPQFALDVDNCRRDLEAMAAWTALARDASMLLADRIVGEGTWVYGGNAAIPGAEPPESIMRRYYALIFIELPPEGIWYEHRGNNEARGEHAYAQATDLQDRIWSFVARHPRLVRVENGKSFADKVARGVGIIEDLLHEVMTKSDS